MRAEVYPKNYFLSIVVLAILLIDNKQVSCFTSEDVTNDLKYIKVCNVSSPISLYAMNDVLLNKNLDNSKSNAFKCFLHCLLTQYGWMDEDGGFLLHDIRETLQQSDVEVPSLEYILYICTTVKSMDRCQRAHFFTECFWKKMEEQQPSEDEFFYSVEQK